MREAYGKLVNRCYRGAPCLLGEETAVIKEAYWDYYDSGRRAYIFIECKINQKFYSQSLLQIEEAEKVQSGVASATYETPDLQLADQNGVWMTRSDDPECYPQAPFEEPKDCSICDLVCDIRDDARYLKDDGTCPYPDAMPGPSYWKIQDGDRPCGDFLHPNLLLNIEATNRKRRKAAKAHIWKYLKDPHWMHTLINSGQRMKDVWERNYQPVTVYYRSFETILQYLKSVPKERRTPLFMKHIRKNLEYSPSFKPLREKDYEQRLLRKLEGMIEDASHIG